MTAKSDSANPVSKCTYENKIENIGAQPDLPDRPDRGQMGR